MQMDALTQPAPKNHNFEARIQALLAAEAKRQDDDTRKLLICASELKEWLEVGFNEANITRVADQAGVSTATLYRLYPDRNQLYLDALKLGNQLLLDMVLDAPGHPHPFRNLIEFAYHLTLIWQQPSVQLFYFIQGFILQTETEITADARAIAAKISQEFRHFVFVIIKIIFKTKSNLIIIKNYRGIKMRRKKYENVLKINKRCIKNKKVKYMEVNHIIKFIIFMLEFIKKSRFILNHKKNK
jgi:AcrR family transcriptional regulator